MNHRGSCGVSSSGQLSYPGGGRVRRRSPEHTIAVAHCAHRAKCTRLPLDFPHGRHLFCGSCISTTSMLTSNHYGRIRRQTGRTPPHDHDQNRRGHPPGKDILFGCWARGERCPHSDIDLLIIQESDLSRPQRYAQVHRLFWGMGVPMDILVYTPEEFARYQSVPGSFTYILMDYCLPSRTPAWRRTAPVCRPLACGSV